MSFCIVTTSINRKKIIESILNEKFKKNEYEIYLIRDFKTINNKTLKKKYDFVLFTSDINDLCFRVHSVNTETLISSFNVKYIFTILNYMQYDNLIIYQESVLDILDCLLKYFYFNRYINCKNIFDVYTDIRNNNKKAQYMVYNDVKLMNFSYLLFYINNITNELSKPYSIHSYEINEDIKNNKGSINTRIFIDTMIKENENEENIILKYYSNLKCSKNILENVIIPQSRNYNLSKDISTEIYYEISTQKIHQIIIGNKKNVLELWEKIKKDIHHEVISYKLITMKNNDIIVNNVSSNIGFSYKIITNINSISLNNRIKNKTKISSGGQSTIFYAEEMNDNCKNKQIILKQFNNIKYTIREYNIFTKFTPHPNIISAPIIVDDDTLSFDKLYPTDIRHLIDNYVNNKIYLPNSFVKYFVHKLFLACRHLLNNNIIHCDYKTENVCISGDEDTIGEPILIDFGNAMQIDKKDNITKKAKGTLHYMAPEILLGKTKNTINSDIWSLGILFLELLINELPWDNVPDLTPRKMIYIIDNMKSKIGELFNKYEHVDPLAIDLLKKILVVDYENRININDILSHDYFKDVDTEWKNNNLLINYIKYMKDKTNDNIIKNNNNIIHNNTDNNNDNYNIEDEGETIL